MNQSYQKVMEARSKDRFCTKDYIERLIDNFMELHGDRCYGDDPAMMGGVGLLGKMPITVLGIQKGTTTAERIQHRFGCAHPEGYRKTQRLLKQAEKFQRPVLCLVDTAGAFCGIEAEERGQSQAIAENLMLLAGLRTPVLSLIIGEGGSGGALALSLGDRIWMLNGTYFSVISPESCASILWKDTGRAQEAAERLKLSPRDLYQLGVIDRILPLSRPSDEEDKIQEYFRKLKNTLEKQFRELDKLPKEQLVEQRYDKYRGIGRWEEGAEWNYMKTTLQ